jgi:hypothetical protein
LELLFYFNILSFILLELLFNSQDVEDIDFLSEFCCWKFKPLGKNWVWKEKLVESLNVNKGSVGGAEFRKDHPSIPSWNTSQLKMESRTLKKPNSMDET